MKKTFIIIPIILLSGCYTLSKAKKQVVKAHTTYPQVTANYCSSFYPSKDSLIIKENYIKGDILEYTDTFFVDCDSIVNANINSPAPIRVAVPCKSTHSTDTVIKVREIVRENTATVESLEFQIKEKDTTIIKQGESISLYKKFMWAFFGLLAVNVILFILKAKKILPF